MSVEGAGWKDGSGIGLCEKSEEKSGVDADKNLPFVQRERWGGTIVACDGEAVNG